MPRAMIEFKKGDLRKDFCDIFNCPIASALRRAGVPLRSVRPGAFSTWDKDGVVATYHDFSKKLCRADRILTDTHHSGPLLKIRYAKLLGKRFQVNW